MQKVTLWQTASNFLSPAAQNCRSTCCLSSSGLRGQSDSREEGPPLFVLLVEEDPLALIVRTAAVCPLLWLRAVRACCDAQMSLPSAFFCFFFCAADGQQVAPLARRPRRPSTPAVFTLCPVIIAVSLRLRGVLGL